MPARPDPALWERRTQTRVPVRTEVRVALSGMADKVVVQNRDLSWGGASLLLPVRPSEVGETLGLEFPWAQGRYFNVRAQVVRAEPVGADQALVGVRFSKLLVRDEERLERLLSMLMDPRGLDSGRVSMAERLEIDFIDRDDMCAVLREVRGGHLHTASFRPYREDQSLLIVFSGLGDLPSLQLRARVERSAALSLGGEAADPGIYTIDLRFEHPSDDLRRAVDPLISRLGGKDELVPAA